MPCGLWQSLQAILPSRIGWCEFFQRSARTFLWQVKHCSAAVVAASCADSDFAECAEWQSVQARPRVSCMLPAQKNCSRPSWHSWQTADFSAAVLLLNEGRLASTSGSSTWSEPGPWQVSQPCAVSLANPGLPCGPRVLPTSSWHSRQVSGPT